MRDAVVSCEEGFCTSGSPCKEGTVGGILKYEDNLMGITSGHVHCTPSRDYDSLCSDRIPCSRVTDSTVDVAFFTFSNKTNDERLFNLLPMRYVRLVCKLGKPFTKLAEALV